MQSPDSGNRKFIVVGLVVVSFIAGAVCSMAGMHWVHIPPAQKAAPVTGSR
jgi:hypothetical protein